MASESSEAKDHFLYFGFASNMSTERIHINNPTAKYVTNGYIKDHELTFYVPNGKVGNWGGAAGTLDKKMGKRAWGTIWKVGMENLKSLDKQENVPHAYTRFEKDIIAENGERLKCVVFMMNEDVIVREREKPSPQYIGVVREGAKEHNLPKEYQEWLASIEDNGYEGKVVIP